MRIISFLCSFIFVLLSVECDEEETPLPPRNPQLDTEFIEKYLPDGLNYAAWTWLLESDEKARTNKCLEFSKKKEMHEWNNEECKEVVPVDSMKLMKHIVEFYGKDVQLIQGERGNKKQDKQYEGVEDDVKPVAGEVVQSTTESINDEGEKKVQLSEVDLLWCEFMCHFTEEFKKARGRTYHLAINRRFYIFDDKYIFKGPREWSPASAEAHIVTKM